VTGADTDGDETENDVWLDMHDISDAKLVMTDALIDAAQHVHNPQGAVENRTLEDNQTKD
jgi:hypothetical protein